MKGFPPVYVLTGVYDGRSSIDSWLWNDFFNADTNVQYQEYIDFDVTHCAQTTEWDPTCVVEYKGINKDDERKARHVWEKYSGKFFHGPAEHIYRDSAGHYFRVLAYSIKSHVVKLPWCGNVPFDFNTRDIYTLMIRADTDTVECGNCPRKCLKSELTEVLMYDDKFAECSVCPVCIKTFD